MPNNCLGQNYVTHIVFEGDSITAGFGVSISQAYPAKLGLNTLARWNSKNSAVSGSTTTSISDVARLAGNTVFVSAAPFKVLSLWIGTNDLHATVDSAATIMARITAYINARKAEGFNKVVVFTILPVNPATPGLGAGAATHEARRLQLNDLIRLQRGTLINDYVDVGVHPILGSVANTTNTTWFSDGVHLTPAAYDIVVELARPVFTAL